MTEYPTREYIIRETTYPDATKQELIGELVRCKDCEFYIIDGCEDYCRKKQYFYDAKVDFCSLAKRKDGEQA